MFTVTYGKQTFGSTTDQVAVFGMPFEEGFAWKKKMMINAVFDKANSTQSVMASKDGFVDHGKWYMASYVSPEDVSRIVCVQLSARTNGVFTTQCALHILPSETGDPINVYANLHNNELSTYEGRVLAFSGKGYVVDKGYLCDNGIDIKRSDRSHWMDPDELEEEFEVVLPKGRDIRPPELMRIEAVDGTVEAVLTSPAPVRRIRFRK